jgi:hypothetical protein
MSFLVSSCPILNLHPAATRVFQARLARQLRASAQVSRQTLLEMGASGGLTGDTNNPELVRVLWESRG